MFQWGISHTHLKDSLNYCVFVFLCCLFASKEFHQTHQSNHYDVWLACTWKYIDQWLLQNELYEVIFIKFLCGIIDLFLAPTFCALTIKKIYSKSLKGSVRKQC